MPPDDLPQSSRTTIPSSEIHRLAERLQSGEALSERDREILDIMMAEGSWYILVAPIDPSDPSKPQSALEVMKRLMPDWSGWDRKT